MVVAKPRLRVPVVMLCRLIHIVPNMESLEVQARIKVPLMLVKKNPIMLGSMMEDMAMLTKLMEIN